ncbi:uncharacterized protein LOC143192515 [Rhynchophorus ferrugineus]|uniref:Uncharacterized protein n=1 Tax=Rhynchophorus ferrugineus TaxID=354439 RepID=A0A834IVK8_RHYFE|nr:hypothetical protein GWI33_021721 [Rhynchophorus ferrugineus]
MPCKNESFTFERNLSQRSSDSSARSGLNCRKRLKETFDESDLKQVSTDQKNKNNSRTDGRRVLSVLNLNDTRKYFRNGADRLSKTFNSVRVSFETISQRFKTSTKRRQILEEGPMTPNPQTPFTKSKQVLGRTPTKLYSPFGIESPYNSTMNGKEIVEAIRNDSNLN